MGCRMYKTASLMAAAALALTACEELENGSRGGFVTLSENVIDIAAPNQDLRAVRVNAEDGCYEYRHIGPVETTFLPLRTKQGRPICTQVEEAAPAKA